MSADSWIMDVDVDIFGLSLIIYHDCFAVWFAEE
jgi:hypothetical protein